MRRCWRNWQGHSYDRDLSYLSLGPGPSDRLYKSGAVVGEDPEDLEGALVFGELFQISFGEHFFDVGFIGGIDQGDAGAFETGTREATAVNTGERTHDVVDGNEFGRAAFIVVDGALARIEREFAEELEVTRFPSRDTLTHATVF